MNWVSSSILAIPYGPTSVGARLRRTGGPSQTDLQPIASLMDDLPEFIYLTGLKGYRFIANTTDWTIRRSHGGLRQIIRLHRRPTPITVRRWEPKTGRVASRLHIITECPLAKAVVATLWRSCWASVAGDVDWLGE